MVVAVKLACARFLARLRPDLGRQPRPLHGRKVAAQPRRPAFGRQRRLDAGVPRADDGNIKLSRNKLFHTRPPR